MLESFLNLLVKGARLTMKDRSFSWDVTIFLAYLLSAKLAQYILLDLHTSPALIWAPTGIALAAVLIKGYKMWLPIALAHIVAVTTIPGHLSLLAVCITTFGFTIQPVLGAWGLQLSGSNGTVYKTRDVVFLIGGSFLIAAIGPLFNTLGQTALHTLSASGWLVFSRAWAGGVLGILIITPCVTGWYYSSRFPLTRKQLPEACAAFGFLLMSTYLLFWTAFPNAFVFLFIFFLSVALFWIALRFGSLVTISALALLAVIGITGSIVAHPTSTPLNQQLFADELFIILITPIFSYFFAVTEERRITARELAQKIRELEEITKELSSNDTAKNEFIAMLAHELRNPLSTVVSALELLQCESLSEEVRGLIVRGQRQVFAMRRLLDDLLDVARITEKKLNIVKEPTNLESIVELCIDTTEEVMHTRGHRCTVSLPEEPLELFVDPIRMEQVVTNLLTNAAKYTPDGGEISLTCVREGERLHIEVRDNGEGIPKEYLEKIFSPFQQIHHGSHRASGIGVGLFLTRKIVEMHGGTVIAQSEGVGKGSTFIVTLPLQTIQPTVSHALGTSGIQKSTGTKKSRHVLVVDDNRPAADGLGKLLSLGGHKVAITYSGAHALETFKVSKPEVLLLDIGLPDISGYEVAKRIRTLSGSGEFPILIALTGYGQEEDRMAALAAGFNHHLTKPVGIAQVEKILNHL